MLFYAGLMKGDGERYIQARIVMNVYSCLGNPQGNKFMPYPCGAQTCLPTMYTSSLQVIWVPSLAFGLLAPRQARFLVNRVDHDLVAAMCTSPASGDAMALFLDFWILSSTRYVKSF